MTTSWRRRALTVAAALAGGALLLLPLVGRGQPPDSGVPPAGNGAAPTSSPASSATLDKLRAEHAALRDALFRSRARRDTLENALSATQLIPIISWEGGRKHVLRTAELRLDGVRIWDSGNTPPGDKPIELASRGIPAGAHVLGVRVEVRLRDNPKLGYLSEQSFTISLPEGKKTRVEITIDEDGDPPSYNPDIEVEIDD
jgi:hypothetical protein